PTPPKLNFMNFMKYKGAAIQLCLILIMCSFQNAYAQRVLLKGTVFDKDYNEPLIGGSVVIKDTDMGVITDMDGNFSIEVSNLPVTMIFSYVGYNSLEIVVNDGSEIKEV